jgi:(4S)-4-hydroxy-5-phosphonooxypentane-2,3-dione isomerase
MIVVHVHIRVTPGRAADFVRATEKNAASSRLEPGVLRFDLLGDPADDHHFVLVEAYRDEQAPAAHKETAHYAEWRDAVAPWMAEPRRSERYVALSPAHESGWRSV